MFLLQPCRQAVLPRRELARLAVSGWPWGSTAGRTCAATKACGFVSQAPQLEVEGYLLLPPYQQASPFTASSILRWLLPAQRGRRIRVELNSVLTLSLFRARKIISALPPCGHCGRCRRGRKFWSRTQAATGATNN